MSNKFSNIYFNQEQVWDKNLLTYQREVIKDLLAILPHDIESILDAGCGNGLITNRLPSELRVVGLDLSAQALESVKREKVQANITSIPFPDGSFDLVMVNDVLEHLTDEEKERALKEITRVAGKYVIITVPLMEDLNRGIARCANCGNYYHINYHRHSFNLNELNSLLKRHGYTCARQILTGDISGNELPEIVLLKRLLGLEWPSSTGNVCSYCGSSKVEPDKNLGRLLTEINRINSLWQSKHPDNQYVMRTECISLFSRPGTALPALFNSRVFIDHLGKEVPLEEEYLPDDRVQFSRADLYKKDILLSYSNLPYYIGGIPSNEGVRLEGDQILLLAFFTRPESEQPVELTLTGSCINDNCIVYVSNYDDYNTYRSPLYSELNNTFTITFPIAFAAWSQYGILLQIRASGPIILETAELNRVKRSNLKFYHNHNLQASYYRIPAQNPVDLSLSLYGEMLPFSSHMERGHFPLPDLPSLLHSDWRAFSKTLQDLLNSEVNSLDTQFRQIAQLELKLNHELRNAASLSQQLEELNTSYEQLARINQELDNENKSLHDQLEIITALYKNTINSRVRSAVRRLGRGPYETPAVYKEEIVSNAGPDISFESDHERRERTYLMICHDQHIDRRILQQAKLLENQGFKGKIIGLSYNNDDYLDDCEGIAVHRIGLKHVFPDCPVYWKYQDRQRLIRWWGRATGILSKANWLLYKVSLLLRYRSRQIHYPLPFDYAFRAAAELYPSELVYAHDLPALKTAVALGEQWNSKIIYDAHELYYEQKAFSKYQKSLMRAIESQYISRCHLVFSVNASLAQEMQKRYDCSNISVLLNAIDPPDDLMTSKEYSLRNHFSLAEEKRILLFQGGLTDNRNLENMVRAMKYVRHPDVIMIVMGNGSLLNTLKKIVAKNKLTHTVLFKEAVPQEQLLYWTASADAGIIPYPYVDLNTYYCTPNKLFEFIQAGIPIIANDLPELRRFVAENGFGITAPLNNAKQIAKAIDSFFATDLLEKCREKLTQHAKEFAWRAQEEDYQTRVLQLFTGFKD